MTFNKKLFALLSPEDVWIGAGAVLQRLAGARLGARPLVDGAARRRRRRRREADVGVHARVDVTAGIQRTYVVPRRK